MPIHKPHGLVRQPQPHRRGAQAGLRFDLFRGQPPAPAGVDCFPVRIVRRFRGMELGARAKAGVEQPLFFQLRERFRIKPRPPALVIRPVRSPRRAALVPVEPQKAQVVLQLVRQRPGGTVRVEVLHAQDHAAPRRARRKPRQQGAQQVPHMHAPAGGGCKPPGDPVFPFYVHRFPPTPLFPSSIPYTGLLR